jgi:branched-chain amino acid transport system permease protein
MTVHTDYHQELRLLKSTAAKVWFGLLLLVLLVIPTALESYLLHLLTLAAIHVIIAIGLNLLTGIPGDSPR